LFDPEYDMDQPKKWETLQCTLWRSEPTIICNNKFCRSIIDYIMRL
jgi:hypothetical protein